MCSGLLPRVDRGGDSGGWCSRCSGGYRRWGLKLAVSLSYPLLKVYGYEFLSSLYLKMKVFMKRNCHTYSLNKQIYNRLIKTCWVPCTQPCAINFGQVKVLFRVVVSTWTSTSSLGFPCSSVELVGYAAYVAYFWPLRPFAILLISNISAFRWMM